MYRLNQTKIGMYILLKHHTYFWVKYVLVSSQNPSEQTFLALGVQNPIRVHLPSTCKWSRRKLRLRREVIKTKTNFDLSPFFFCSINPWADEITSQSNPTTKIQSVKYGVEIVHNRATHLNLYSMRLFPYDQPYLAPSIYHPSPIFSLFLHNSYHNLNGSLTIIDFHIL